MSNIIKTSHPGFEQTQKDTYNVSDMANDTLSDVLGSGRTEQTMQNKKPYKAPNFQPIKPMQKLENPEEENG